VTRLYIAGPMSGYPEHNFPAFNQAAEQLRAAGYDVENPADTGLVDGWEWADYLRFDLPLMLKCDGVAGLFGWQDSKGACLEMHVAEELGMPIRAVAWWVQQAEVYAA
jgi:hypothetical protein